MKEQATRAILQKERVGLVGAAVSDFHGIGELCEHIISQGGKVSVSSLRIDGLNPSMIEMLKKSGHKTVALAPEGGSQRLRDLVKKDLSEDQILNACELLISKDILNIKLYFIIGLPTESEDDLHEMILLVEKIRSRVIDAARANRRLGEVVLSVNPFVPKPCTPFQWCGMENIKSLEQKVSLLQKKLGKLSNVRLKVENPKDAYLQALLSRGDRRIAALLLAADEEGSWRRGAKKLNLDTDSLVYRTIPLDEFLPWDFIHGAIKERLAKEYRRAFP
jgi:radical SAM superfamily enzyme YgiQ (UPF0313 family)